MTEPKGTKRRRRISPDDVPHVFNDRCISHLVSLAKLPERADISVFRTEVQRAALIYLRDAVEPSGNDRRKEVEALYRLASGRKYDQLKICLAQISTLSQSELNGRGSRFSVPAMLPEPALLDDPLQRDGVCETVMMLSQHGGQWVEGRKRPSGRRSRTWEPLLFAPQAQRHPRRREAECTFVMWLQLAYLDAAGDKPALTASAERPGPFARLVRECLDLVGAREADAVGVINDLHAARLAHRDGTCLVPKHEYSVD